MPKITVTFHLPKEESEFQVHRNAVKLQSIVYEFTNKVRDYIKHGDGKKIDWQDVSDLWWQTLKDEHYDPYVD